MFRKFKFEEEVYEQLPSIPMSTRYKLDRVGLRLSLDCWRRFSEEEKRVLCHLPTRSQGEADCYRRYLVFLLRRLKEKPEMVDPAVSDREKAQWEDLAQVPKEVYLKALQVDIILTSPDWIKLDDLERYSLMKFATEPYSQKWFEMALREFLGVPIPRPVASPGKAGGNL